MKRNTLVFAVAVLAVLGFSLAYILGSGPQNGVEPGDKVLDLEIPSVEEGNTIHLRNYRGRVLILDFLAPWCDPCREQVDHLRVVERLEGVEVVSVNIDPGYRLEDLRGFKEEEGITWFLGHSPQAGFEFQVSAIPTTIVVDQEGVIRYRGFFTSATDLNHIVEGLVG